MGSFIYLKMKLFLCLFVSRHTVRHLFNS